MAKWYRTGLLSLELGVQVPLGVPVASSSSGLGPRPFKAKIAGSTPAEVT